MIPKNPTYNIFEYTPKDSVGFIPSYNGSLGYYSNTEYWWNPLAQNAMSHGTVSLTRSTIMYFIPFFCGYDLRINKMSINVTTARTGNFTNIGIYSNSKESYVWYPDKLLYNSSPIFSNSTGVKTQAITSINLVLEVNMLYWFAIANGGGTANPAYRAVATGAQNNFFNSLDTAMGTSMFSFLELSFAYTGAFPYTAPTGATLTTLTATPLIALQVNTIAKTFEGNIKP